MKDKRDVYTCASFLPEQRTTNATDPPDNPHPIQQHSRGAEHPTRAGTRHRHAGRTTARQRRTRRRRQKPGAPTKRPSPASH